MTQIDDADKKVQDERRERIQTFQQSMRDFRKVAHDEDFDKIINNYEEHHEQKDDK